MKKILIFVLLIFIAGFSFGHKKRKNLIKVALIKNNGDTVYVQTKKSYVDEFCFNSFGYYNEDGSRGRAQASEYRKIIIGDKYLESVKLKSTVKKECEKQVFLERLIDGPMIMYLFHYTKEMVFASKCIEEVYIRKANEECAYPLYKEPCPNTLAVLNQPDNKEDIVNLFSDVPEIVEKIESGIYHREDFEEMILEYNKIMDR